MNMGKKKCCKCKEVKDLLEFYKNKNMKDGHGNYCKYCTKNSSKQYYQKKTKYQNSDDTEVIKLMMLSAKNENSDNRLIRIIMIEKLCYAVLDEVNKLKIDIENVKQTVEEEL